MAMTFCSRRTFRGGKTRAASSSGCQLTLTEKDEVGLSCPRVIPGKAPLCDVAKGKACTIKLPCLASRALAYQNGPKKRFIHILDTSPTFTH